MNGTLAVVLNILLPRGSRRRKLVAKLLRRGNHALAPFEAKHSRNHDPSAVADALKKHYFAQPDMRINDVDAFLRTKGGADFLEDHMERRLNEVRRSVVPWLDHLRPLAGARILEIGCGTGSSTVALAEQGAMVTGIEVVEGALKVAEVRCRVHRVDARLLVGNSTEMEELCRGGQVDFLIFFASLEHMTTDERLESLKAAWRMLSTGGFLVVLEAPNRLWYLDSHTSWAPFFMWLPDDIAVLYSRFTPREFFNTFFAEESERNLLLLSRWGRGVSFHEFQLALNRVDLPVASCLDLFHRTRLTEVANWQTVEHRYERLLKEIYPRVHPGFSLPYLNLALKK